MTKHTFIDQCDRMHVILSSDRNSRTKDQLSLMCKDCPIRAKILSGELDFDPPHLLEFIEIPQSKKED